MKLDLELEAFKNYAQIERVYIHSAVPSQCLAKGS